MGVPLSFPRSSLAFCSLSKLTFAHLSLDVGSRFAHVLPMFCSPFAHLLLHDANLTACVEWCQVVQLQSIAWTPVARLRLMAFASVGLRAWQPCESSDSFCMPRPYLLDGMFPCCVCWVHRQVTKAKAVARKAEASSKAASRGGVAAAAAPARPRVAGGSVPADHSPTIPNFGFGVRGAELVGRRIEVYWGGDDAWYAGEVTAYDPKRKIHDILYDDNAEGELDVNARDLDGSAMCPYRVL